VLYHAAALRYEYSRDRHRQNSGNRCSRYGALDPPAAVPPVQVIETATQYRRGYAKIFVLAKLAKCLPNIAAGGNIAGQRLYFHNPRHFLALFVNGDAGVEPKLLGEHGRRVAVYKDRQYTVYASAVHLFEMVDFGHAPLGLLQLWRTQHYQIAGVFQRGYKVVTQVSAGWQLRFITEYSGYLLGVFASQAGRRPYMFQQRLQPVRHSLIQRQMPIAYKRVVLP